jgi:hypothetical protein
MGDPEGLDEMVAHPGWKFDAAVWAARSAGKLGRDLGDHFLMADALHILESLGAKETT